MNAVSPLRFQPPLARLRGLATTAALLLALGGPALGASGHGDINIDLGECE